VSSQSDSPDSPVDSRGDSPGDSLRTRLGPLLRALGPLVGLVFVWSLFAVLAGANFTSWENQRLMLLQTAVVGTAAIGATLVIVSGGIDLSVGSTIALGTVVIALGLRAGASPALAALGGLAAAASIGLVIGAMVVGHMGRVGALAAGAFLAWSLSTRVGTPGAFAIGASAAVALFLLAWRFLPRLELSPFIVTLGLWGALRGLAKGLGDNQPVYPESLGWIERLMVSGQGGLGSLLAPGVWILFALAALFALVLNATVFGRHVFAVGSNERTARLCGVRVERVKVLVYVLGVGCAGIAALLQLSFLSIGDPTTASGAELRVIAAVVIGGASLAGGEGSIRGTLVGALIMVVVDNGCTKLGLENWVQEVVTGAIIVAAVALDSARHLRGRSG